MAGSAPALTYPCVRKRMLVCFHQTLQTWQALRLRTSAVDNYTPAHALQGDDLSGCPRQKCLHLLCLFSLLAGRQSCVLFFDICLKHLAAPGIGVVAQGLAKEA